MRLLAALVVGVVVLEAVKMIVIGVLILAVIQLVAYGLKLYAEGPRALPPGRRTAGGIGGRPRP